MREDQMWCALLFSLALFFFGTLGYFSHKKSECTKYAMEKGYESKEIEQICRM